MEQTREDGRITEPLNVLLVSGEFPLVTREEDTRTFYGVDTPFNSTTRFCVERESGFTYASMQLLNHPEGKKYDVLITDLSLRTWITGSPIMEPNNYGLILALQAVSAGVPYIGVVFNKEDAQLGPRVLEEMVGAHFEHGKGRGIFTIQHEQQSSKVLIASAPVVVDNNGFPQRSHYAFFEELLKGTLHEHYAKRSEEDTT